MTRLDKALQLAGLAPSRSQATQLIHDGHVSVDGAVVRKASTRVQPHQRLETTDSEQWVSRAARKLLGALEIFDDVTVTSRRCLDAGASTGGFTQVLLTQSAAHVVAIDVGHDQLAPSLREHPQVTNIEGRNLRHLQSGELGEPFDLVVADLSFISLRLVVHPLAEQMATGADMLLMVKPQFEVGREHIGRTGVVTSPELRRHAVAGVLDAAHEVGLTADGLARSPLPGQDGNTEFFLHLRKTSQGSAGVSHSADTVGLDVANWANTVLDSVTYGD